MILTNIKIENYKSFGAYDNTLKLESKVTTLIGKNESGKSNLLEILKSISFINGIGNNELIQINRRFSQEKVVVSVICELTEEEKLELGVSDKITKFSFAEPQKVIISGTVSEYFKGENVVMKVERLKNIYSEGHWNRDSNVRNFINSYINKLTDLDTMIYMNYKTELNNINYYSKGIEEIKDEVNQICNELISIIDAIYSKFPEIYFYKEEKLENSYFINDEFIKKSYSSNSQFNKLLKASKISIEDIKMAFGDNPGSSEDMREDIREKFKNNLERTFRKFYTQESVNITPRFNNNNFSVLIKTSLNNMKLSERSNGLQWYFNFFIDLLSNNLEDKNVIYLIDEPGVYLHVNAQKELINLFKELTKSKNQLLYSTHSPYMIDNDNLIGIRALEKLDGITHIINSVYGSNLGNMDTLTPLLNAIGLDLKYNLGPSLMKKNLIVEGITDYMYISAMMKYMNLGEYNIIPSIGAGSVDKIASILFGWGCKFKIILDHDAAGHGQAKKLEEGLGLKLNTDYVYVNSANNYEKGIVKTIESLVSEEDNNKLQFKYDCSNSIKTKKIAAKCFYDAVINKDIILSAETINNFDRLFKLLD